MNRVAVSGVLRQSFCITNLRLLAAIVALGMVSLGLVAHGVVAPAWAKPGDPASKTEATADDDPFAPAKSGSPPPATPPAKQPAPRDLPWAKKKLKSDALPLVRPPANVREIMERYDIGESQMSGFFNNQPLSISEQEVLVRILFRLPRIGIENIEKWRKPDLQLDQLLANAAAHRLEVIPLKGRLIGIEKKDVTPELAVRLEFKHFYLARIDLPDLGYEALVAVRRIPEYWLTKEELNEAVSLDGIFIKAGESIDGVKPQLIFASRRIRWQPDQPIPELHIGADQLRLAELGFDLSLLEDLRTTNKQPIGDLDREPQYQLLHLVGKVPLSKLVSDPPKTIDIVELLKAPEQHQGEFVSVYGFARRITKVVVDDPDIRARFGISYYYEIDVAVDLKEKTIRFVDDTKAKPGEDPEGTSAENPDEKTPPNEDAVFNNDYPVTVVVRELPESLKPADAMRELVHIDGVFMKTWAYRNNYMAKFGNRLQVAPLIVAKRPVRVVPDKIYNWVSDVLVGFAMAVAVLVMGAVFWWFRTADRGIRKTLQELDERAPPPSFAGLENAPTRPDFSSIEQPSPPPQAPK